MKSNMSENKIYTQTKCLITALCLILCGAEASAKEFKVYANRADHCYDESGVQQGWVQKSSHRLGAQTLDRGNTGITFPFLLPKIPPQHVVTDLTLEVFIEDVNNLFESSKVYAAVYGCRTDADPTVLASDTITAYAEGTLMGDNLFRISNALRVGRQTLKLSPDYIQSLYEAGKAGQYVFLTLLPNTTVDLENRFASVASANNSILDRQPSLLITTDVQAQTSQAPKTSTSPITPVKPSITTNSATTANTTMAKPSTTVKEKAQPSKKDSTQSPSLIFLGLGSFLFILLCRIKTEDE